RRVAEMMIKKGFPKEVVINLNVPSLPLAEIKGLQITRQGLRVYHDELLTRTDPRGVPYYWIGGEPPSGVPDQGTDFGAIKSGYASLTPLNLDLTAVNSMVELTQLFSEVKE
ncbi:MAG: 5'/3'-nucleotidase SurE, partial [Anaerolineales bacterium]|nr:5'/3'-nucleotidase SurE [Anaerolineales bacterium]